MGQAAAKRFYTHVQSRPEDGGWTIVLDDRPVKTPMAKALVVPCHALAEAIAAEWDAQTDQIRPATMPMTQLAITAIDRMMADRGDVVAALSAYGGSDLLCYRADGPDALVAREAELWQPLLDWAADTFEAPLVVTAGVLPVAQPEASLQALQMVVDAMAPFELAVLGAVTPVTGSLIIGLAFINGRLCAKDALDAAFVDEAFQAECWGEDEESQMRRDAIEQELDAAERFLNLLRISQ